MLTSRCNPGSSLPHAGRPVQTSARPALRPHHLRCLVLSMRAAFPARCTRSKPEPITTGMWLSPALSAWQKLLCLTLFLSEEATSRELGENVSPGPAGWGPQPGTGLGWSRREAVETTATALWQRRRHPDGTRCPQSSVSASRFR